MLLFIYLFLIDLKQREIHMLSVIWAGVSLATFKIFYSILTLEDTLISQHGHILNVVIWNIVVREHLLHKSR